MRKANSYGTVFKLKGTRRNPWVARVTTGWETVTALRGKRAGQEYARPIYHAIGYYHTRAEAEQALSRYIDHPTPKGHILLSEIYEEWSTSKYPRTSKSNADTYRAAWKRLEHLGRHPFTDLRTQHWQKVIDETELSRSSKQKIKALVSSLYEYARRNDIVSQNYARYIELPPIEKKDLKVFTDTEIKTLQNNIDIPFVDSILFMIYTGFRINEMLSLTRFSVNLEEEIIKGGLKTEAGKNRVIPIHPKLIPLIKQRLLNNSEYLFSESGKKINPDRYRTHIYYPLLEQLGISRKVPHVCRHTFGTRMARAGITPLHIKMLMGHSNYAFTADTYTHLEVKELKNSISQI